MCNGQNQRESDEKKADDELRLVTADVERGLVHNELCQSCRTFAESIKVKAEATLNGVLDDHVDLQNLSLRTTAIGEKIADRRQRVSVHCTTRAKWRVQSATGPETLARLHQHGRENSAAAYLGQTARNIVKTIRDMDSAEILPRLISKRTGANVERVWGWQARPLHEVYAIVYLSRIAVKRHHERTVINSAIYLHIGTNLESHKG